jgi:hypothetical protein
MTVETTLPNESVLEMQRGGERILFFVPYFHRIIPSAESPYTNLFWRTFYLHSGPGAQNSRLRGWGWGSGLLGPRIYRHVMTSALQYTNEI